MVQHRSQCTNRPRTAAQAPVIADRAVSCGRIGDRIGSFRGMSEPHPDLLHALETLGDELGRAMNRLTEAALRTARSSSADALGQLLASPARPFALDALFWKLGRELDRKRSKGLTSTVLCRITGGAEGDHDVYQLNFRDGRCQVRRGSDGSKAELTITLDDAELVRLATRQSTPMQGVFNGRIKVGGNVGNVAASLASMFLAAPE